MMVKNKSPNIQEINNAVKIYHDDILILKRDVNDLKCSFKLFGKKLNDLDNKLFIGNGNKSIITRLNILESKVLQLFAGIGVLGVIAIKWIWEVITK